MCPTCQSSNVTQIDETYNDGYSTFECLECGEVFEDKSLFVY